MIPPQAVAIGSLAPFRHRASAATGPAASCKLLGFGSPRHALCTKCVAKKTHARAFDSRNAFNGNASDEEAPAAQFKLNRTTWNPSNRLLSYVHIQTDLPDDRRASQTSLAAATSDRARPSTPATATHAAPVRNRTARPDTQSVKVSWKMSEAQRLTAAAHIREIQRVVLRTLSITPHFPLSS